MYTVLITGASSGIGMELAKIYAKNKNNLILVARRENKLIELKNELEKFNIQVEYIIKDLSKQNSAMELYKELENKPIDILINNAGFGTFGEFSEIDYYKENDMINLNILTLTNLTKLFLKDMKKRNFGKIINVASTAAFQPIPFMAVYAATKSYVLNLSIALNSELKDKYQNIKVFALCPGATKSEFLKIAGVEKTSFFRGKLPTSETVAKYAYKKINKNQTFIVHGVYNKILIFLERFLSKKIISEIIRKTI